MKIHYIVLSLLVTSSAFASQKVIYDEDNREDIYSTSDNMYKEIAMATAGMVSKRKLRKNSDNSGTYRLADLKTLGKDYGVCEEQRFTEQPLLANCSGFLIAEDILVTAGHCVQNDILENCASKNYWVFGLQMNNEKEINTSRIPKENIYKCKEWLNVELPRHNGNTLDYAVIRLDRKVKDRLPLQVRTQGKVANNTKLGVIGHPTMMPLKVADNGTIINNLTPDKMTTTLDTFGGNSGSVVFDQDTGLVEGILVSGKQDYVRIKERGCKVVNQCEIDFFTGQPINCLYEEVMGRTDLSPGEKVTRIKIAIKGIEL